MEDAWLEEDFERVEQLAREHLANAPNDAHGRAWLGLALFATERADDGQVELARSVELFRASLADEELNEELLSIANRLIEALGEGSTSLAQFVVGTLGIEHSPSLRLLAEDLAGAQGDQLQATALLKRALAVDATDPESHYLAARLFARRGRKPNVISHLKKALDHAAGTLAVRSLARLEPDFDGFRHDDEFNALIDRLPIEPVLRPLYAALDAGDLHAVIELAPTAEENWHNKLDVLYVWREAVELALDSDETEFGPLLERLNTEIEAHEDADEESPHYARFCGDA